MEKKKINKPLKTHRLEIIFLAKKYHIVTILQIKIICEFFLIIRNNVMDIFGVKLYLLITICKILCIIHKIYRWLYI